LTTWFRFPLDVRLLVIPLAWVGGQDLGKTVYQARGASLDGVGRVFWELMWA
jgi:hypothetical protein